MIAAFFGVLVLVAAGYFVGEKSGRAEEKIAVAKVLAEYYTTDDTVKAFVKRILGSLKTEYTIAFDGLVKYYDDVKKEL